MKTTVVPAQVTTVEDRIIGRLGFSQILLLIIPIFFSAGTFTLLPPILESALYKYILIAILLLICIVLSIRIQGRIVALWLIMILRYNARSKYYVCDKNTTALREQHSDINQTENAVTPVSEVKHHTSELAIADSIKVRRVIDNPAVKMRFETDKKGGFHVRLTEVDRQIKCAPANRNQRGA